MAYLITVAVAFLAGFIVSSLWSRKAAAYGERLLDLFNQDKQRVEVHLREVSERELNRLRGIL